MRGNLQKPTTFALAKIPAEMGRQFIYSTGGEIGEIAIEYFFGVVFIGYFYKAVKPGKLKTTAKINI